MSKPEEKDVELSEKKIDQLKPSELKARIYANTFHLDSEVLQKAADALYKEDISGSLFFEMKIEDFKELGLTFGCRNALVKYRDKLKPESVRISNVQDQEHKVLENESPRLSREEGEVLNPPQEKNEADGESTEHSWEYPELPLPTETENRSNDLRLDNSGEATENIIGRKHGSSIFEMPVNPFSNPSADEKPTPGGLLTPGEPTTSLDHSLLDDENSQDEKLSDVIESVGTEDLLAVAEEWLELEPPLKKADAKGIGKRKSFDVDDIKEHKLDAADCCPSGATGCAIPGHGRFNRSKTRVLYKESLACSPLQKRSRSEQLSRTNIRPPKVKPRPLETESFDLLVDPKALSKTFERTSLARLRHQNRILKEGWYEKAHGHREKWKKLGWDARYGVLLKNGMLVYFAELPLEKEGCMAFKRTVNLSTLQMVNIQHGTDDWRIKIHSANSSPPTHLFRYASKKEMHEWRDLLLEVGS